MQGAAAEAGEMEKDARHDTFVTSTSSKFESLVVESLACGLLTASAH